MRVSMLCAATALALGSIGLAYAGPVLTNGNFSATSPAQTTPTQFGAMSAGSACNIDGRTYGGQFVTGWSGASSSTDPGQNPYQNWYPSAHAASTVQECTRYGPSGGEQLLPTLVTAPTGGAFVGLDGQDGVQGGISQTITNLISGHKYTVTFDWASTQELSRDGATWSYLQVGFGNDATQSTTANEIMSHGFSGWGSASMTFTASGTYEALNFLAFGGQVLCNDHVFTGTLASCTDAGGTLSQVSFADSSGVPPFAILANVSMTAVPEPPELAMFGGGLLGLGLLTMFARRRMQKRWADGEDVDLL